MRLVLVAFSAVFFAVQSASSAIMTFDNLSAFEEAAGPTQSEDFDGVGGERDFTNRTVRVGDIRLTTELNSANTLSSFNRVLIAPGFNDLQDFQGAASTNAISRSSNFAHVGIRPGDSFTLLFDEPMYSFGADFKGFNDTLLRTRISVDGQIINVPVTDGPRRQFVGIVSDTPFASILFRGPESNGFGIDNLRYSSLPPPTSEIPIPGGLPLMATALAAGAFIVRRRKTHA